MGHVAKVRDLAWAAGIIDGEGCLSICYTPASAHPGCLTDRTTFHLKVTMGHKPTVVRLRAILGVGTIQDHVAKTDRVNASYSWVASSRKAQTALLAVRPYLYTKAKEADIALKYLALPLALYGGRGGNRPIPKSLHRRRGSLYWRLRQLKPRWRFYAEALRG